MHEAKCVVCYFYRWGKSRLSKKRRQQSSQLNTLCSWWTEARKSAQKIFYGHLKHFSQFSSCSFQSDCGEAQNLMSRLRDDDGDFNVKWVKDEMWKIIFSSSQLTNSGCVFNSALCLVHAERQHTQQKRWLRFVDSQQLSNQSQTRPWNSTFRSNSCKLLVNSFVLKEMNRQKCKEYLGIIRCWASWCNGKNWATGSHSSHTLH